MIKKYKKYILTFLFFILGTPIVSGDGETELYQSGGVPLINSGQKFFYKIASGSDEYLRYYDVVNDTDSGNLAYMLGGPFGGRGIIDTGYYIILLSRGYYSQYSTFQILAINKNTGDISVNIFPPFNGTPIGLYGNYIDFSLYGDNNGNWGIYLTSSYACGGLCSTGINFNGNTLIESSTPPGDLIQVLTPEFYYFGIFNFFGPVQLSLDNHSVLGYNNNNWWIMETLATQGAEILNWKYQETSTGSFRLSITGPDYNATTYRGEVFNSGSQLLYGDLYTYPGYVLSNTNTELEPYLIPYSGESGSGWVMEEYDFYYGRPLLRTDPETGIIYYARGSRIYSSAETASPTPIPGSSSSSSSGGGGGESQSDLDELLDTNFVYDKDGDGSISFSEAIQAPFVFFGGIFNLLKQGIGNFYEFIIKFQKLSPNIE